MNLSPRLLSENMAKHTPGGAVWEDDKGEAGNYVEVHSQGGIISFDDDCYNTVRTPTLCKPDKLDRPLFVFSSTYLI
jgi:hypothetical protein